MPIIVTGRAPTERAHRYVKQLASHLGEKLKVTSTPGSIEVHYQEAVAVVTPTSSAIEWTIRGEERNHVIETMGVVAGHLEKFGAREGLTCSWNDAALAAEYVRLRDEYLASRGS